jgi:hypothetical protein
MTYFPDLTEYAYTPLAPGDAAPKNIGWLGASVEFETRTPEPEFLERLWLHCLVSVAQTRGLYECHLCAGKESNVAQRDGKQLLLGSAEIRVLSRTGDIYAAPNLIYHYVSVHHYAPPKEFVEAVTVGVPPSSKEYFDRLSQLGISWTPTLTPSPNNLRVRFVRTPEGVKRIEE